MHVLPWRVRNILSELFPLTYHLTINLTKPRNSQEYWDRRLAETWDTTGRSWPEKVEAITRVLNDRHMHILDVGCGTGTILRSLCKKGYTNVHGLELSAYAVSRLASQGINMSQGSVLRMPFADGTFDAVIASEVLEHIVRRTRFMRELTRVVKPSGRILIFVPDNCLGPIDEPEHVIKYNKHSLRKFLSEFWILDEITTVKESHNRDGCLFAVCRTHESTSSAQPRKR